MIQVIGNRLYQWDSNRQVLLTNEDADATQVHFSNPCLCKKDENYALVVEVQHEEGLTFADIPNSLLMNGHDISAYTWKDDKTIHGRKFPVTKRKKPASYIYEPTDVLTMESLKKWVEDQIENLEMAGPNSDYIYLKNKPSINSVTLIDDKTFEQLGLAEVSEEDIDSMF